jgi:hypothetical protein
VGISEGGRCIFLFGELCVCVCGGDVLSDFVHSEMGKMLSESLTAFYPSSAPQNSLFQSRFEEMAGAKEDISLSQTMRKSGGGSGG